MPRGAGVQYSMDSRHGAFISDMKSLGGGGGETMHISTLCMFIILLYRTRKYVHTQLHISFQI